jgi:RNA polymerase sigma-70 factor (ECF subfamily)
MSVDDDAALEDGEDSFTAWYRSAYRGLLHTLVLAIGDAEVATDATSEAFARAFQRWDRVSQMSSPIGWTYTVALNVARRMLRRAQFESLVLRRRPPSPPVRDDGLELWDAVQRLPLRQRTAVALYYLSDLSQRDIADAMGVAEGTVAATLHEARRRLASALSQPVERNDCRHG